jgi:hypothetical protein
MKNLLYIGYEKILLWDQLFFEGITLAPPTMLFSDVEKSLYLYLLSGLSNRLKALM